MVSVLISWSSGPGLNPDRDIVSCSWARHLTLTVSLSTQEYKWVPVNCWGNLTNCRGVTCDGLGSRQGGAEILLATLCCRNWDKLQQLWASPSIQGFPFFFQVAPPPEIVTSLPVPSTSSISFHPIKMFSNRRQDGCSHTEPEVVKFPVAEIPYSFQLDHVSTLFAKVS